MEKYTDQVRVNVRVLDGMPGSTPTEEWYVVFNAGGLTDREKIREDLLAEMQASDYTLAEKHYTHHWGASAAHFEILMELGVNAVGGTIGALFAPRIDAFWKRIRPGEDIAPLTEEDARRHARGILCRRFQVNFGDLVPITTEIDMETNRARIEMHAPPNPTVYTVELKQTSGQTVTIAKINVRHI